MVIRQPCRLLSPPLFLRPSVGEPAENGDTVTPANTTPILVTWSPFLIQRWRTDHRAGTDAGEVR